MLSVRCVSWLSRWPPYMAPDMLKFASIPAALRDCGEAYTVLNFFYFMSTYLEVHFDDAPYKVLQNALSVEDVQPVTHTPIVTPSIQYPTVAHPILSPHARAPWRLDPSSTSSTSAATRHSALRDGRAVERFGRRVGSLAASNDASSTAQLLSPKNWLDFVQFNVANHAIYCLVLFYYATCKKSQILVPAEPFWKFVTSRV